MPCLKSALIVTRHFFLVFKFNGVPQGRTAIITGKATQDKYKINKIKSKHFEIFFTSSLDKAFVVPQRFKASLQMFIIQA